MNLLLHVGTLPARDAHAVGVLTQRRGGAGTQRGNESSTVRESSQIQSGAQIISWDLRRPMETGRKRGTRRKPAADTFYFFTLRAASAAECRDVRDGDRP